MNLDLGPGWQLQTFTEECVQWIRRSPENPEDFEIIRLSKPASILLTECYHLGFLEACRLEDSSIRVVLIPGGFINYPSVKIDLMNRSILTAMDIRAEAEQMYPGISALLSISLAVTAAQMAQNLFARLTSVRP